MNTKLLIMAVVLVVAILAVAVALRRSHRERASKIDLEDLILGVDRRISPERCILLAAFGLHSWLIVYLTVAYKIDNGYIATYSAIWVTPLLLKVFTNASIERAKAMPAPPEPSKVVGAEITVDGGAK